MPRFPDEHRTREDRVYMASVIIIGLVIVVGILLFGA